MPSHPFNGNHNCVLLMSVAVGKGAEWKTLSWLLFHSHKKGVFHGVLCQVLWWGPAKTEWDNSPRRHVAETRLGSAHARPIQTIQPGNTQAHDSVCRLWPDNEGFPASAVIKSHSPQPLHPDWGEGILTQPVWHRENSLCICFKGIGCYSGQPRPVMEENVFSFLIIPFCGETHLAMPILCGWKLLHPS